MLCYSLEFGHEVTPRMNFRIEGHTAPSKLSSDNGKKTSADRAQAVVDSVCQHNAAMRPVLWPEGFGDCRAPGNRNDDPRRVEVVVMTVLETALAVWQARGGVANPSAPHPFVLDVKAAHRYLANWKNGTLGKVPDYKNKMDVLMSTVERKRRGDKCEDAAAALSRENDGFSS